MSDNQVTEPIETACFCKHGNLGQHESDCPKCPLHFTRGELNALQRERDQLRADLSASNQYGEHWHKQACDADSKHYSETIAHAKTKTELKQLRAELAKVREERDQTHNANKKLKFGWQRIGDQFKGGNGPRECFRFQAAAKKNEGEVVGTILDCIFGIWDDLAKAEKQNATLTAKLEQAREDKEGLDWLETVHWGISTWRNDDGEKVWMAWDNDKDTEHTVRSAPTLRAAITLARLAAKTEK